MVGQCWSAKRCPTRDRSTRNNLSCSPQCLRLDPQRPRLRAFLHHRHLRVVLRRLRLRQRSVKHRFGHWFWRVLEMTFRCIPELPQPRSVWRTDDRLSNLSEHASDRCAQACSPRNSVTRIVIKSLPLLGDDFQRGDDTQGSETQLVVQRSPRAEQQTMAQDPLHISQAANFHPVE